MDERQLRKYQSMLAISGMGVVLFGAWSIAKTILMMVYAPDRLVDAQVVDQAGFSRLVFNALMIAFLLPDLILRMYVGLSARAEAMGVRRGSGYIVIAWLMALFLIFTVVSSVALFILYGDFGFSSLFDEVAIDAVNATSASALIEVAVSARRVKKLRG